MQYQRTGINSTPHYVVITGDGVPIGFNDLNEALDMHYLLTRIPYAQVDPDQRVRDVALLGDGETVSFFEHIHDVSPRMGMVVPNVAYWPIEAFINAPILARPKSEIYLHQACEQWEAIESVRVGDAIIQPKSSHTYCKALKDCPFRMTRVTSILSEGVQTGGGSGGYHIGQHGPASYSGSLDESVSFDSIVDTGKRRWGQFWFFLDGFAGARRGVNVLLPIRIYKETEKR